MSLLRPVTARQLDIALMILRVVVGITFVAHGGQKLFVFGLEGVTGSFAQIGIPLPELAGPAVALLEFFGGMALILGLLTRLAALGLAITMLGAMLLVHVGGGFFLPDGYEFTFVLLGASAALALTGAGTHSLDARIAGSRASRAAS